MAKWSWSISAARRSRSSAVMWWWPALLVEKVARAEASRPTSGSPSWSPRRSPAPSSGWRSGFGDGGDPALHGRGRRPARLRCHGRPDGGGPGTGALDGGGAARPGPLAGSGAARRRARTVSSTSPSPPPCLRTAPARHQRSQGGGGGQPQSAARAPGPRRPGSSPAFRSPRPPPTRRPARRRRARWSPGRGRPAGRGGCRRSRWPGCRPSAARGTSSPFIRNESGATRRRRPSHAVVHEALMPSVQPAPR